MFERAGAEAASGRRRASTLPARTVLRRRRHDARTSPTRRSTPGTFELDAKAKFFQAARARRAAATAAFTLEPPDAERLLHVATTHDGTLRQLLRRQPPALRRQRRQGDGVGARTATRTSRRCSPTRSPALRRRRRSRRATRAWRAFADAPRRRARAPRSCDVDPPDADHRRGGRARAGGGAPLPARASSIGCRTTRSHAPLRRRHAPRDGGDRAHRRVGRQGEGPAVADRRSRWAARRACARALQPGEPVVRHGPDRHADRDPDAARRCCSPAAASATPCSSRSRRALRGARQPVIYFAGYKKRRGPLQARGDRGGAPTRSIWSADARRGDRAAPPAGPRTSAATSCRRWSPTRSGELGDELVAARRRATASSPSAPTA